MSKELSSTTKGKDAFEVVYNFFKQNEIDWKKLIGCTTDGAPSMLGRKSGFTTYMETQLLFLLHQKQLLFIASYIDLPFARRCFLRKCYYV